MDSLNYDISRLQSKICQLIEEFETNHDFAVTNINYLREKRPNSNDSLFGFIKRSIVLDIKLETEA